MEDFINVPVPARHVTAVYALIASREQAGSGGVAPATAGGGISGHRWSAFGDWPTARLQELMDSRQTSVQRAAEILDVLAEEPGKHIPISELAARMGVTREELRGALSGFTRWLRRNQEEDTWPFNYQAGPGKAEDVAEETHYWVSAATADAWLKLRRAAKAP